MKIEITDEMVRTAHDVFRPRLGGCPTHNAVRAALEVIAPLIADMALERAAQAARAERRGREGYNNDYERGVMAMSHTIEDAIRALKDPTP